MKLCLSFFLIVGALTSYAASEIEPNNSSATANGTVPGQSTTGQLASATDQDWFGFSMSSAGTVTVAFDSPPSTSPSANYTVQVVNAAGTIFASVDIGGDTSFQTGLPSAGTYYVVVRGGPQYFTTAQYTISILTSGSQTAETEPNNTLGTANALPLGQNTTGQLASATDQDWFGFSMSSAGTVTVAFDSPPSTSPSANYTVQVVNAAGTIFASVDIGGDTSFQTGLPSAGTYYVVVRGGPQYFTTAQYTIFILTSGSQTDETEPNDSSATANGTVPGQNTRGQLASATDQDWFGFSMSSAGTVTVAFVRSDPGAIASFTVQVVNAAGTIFASVNMYNSRSFQTGLPSAGTYYVVVRAGGFTTAQYTISILTSGSQSAETEPNNTFGTANALPLGQNTTGQLSSATDQDWFGFSMSSAGTVTVAFVRSDPGAIASFTVQVVNAAGTIFASVNMYDSGSFQTGLPSAGTYYVVVRAGGFTTAQYGLTVTTTASSAPTVVQAQIFTAVEVVWNSTVGKSYVVEWSPDMSANSWIPLSPTYAGTGGTMSYLDSIRGETKAFYRVKEN